MPQGRPNSQADCSRCARDRDRRPAHCRFRNPPAAHRETAGSPCDGRTRIGRRQPQASDLQMCHDPQGTWSTVAAQWHWFRTVRHRTYVPSVDRRGLDNFTTSLRGTPVPAKAVAVRRRCSAKSRVRSRGYRSGYGMVDPRVCCSRVAGLQRCDMSADGVRTQRAQHSRSDRIKFFI